MALLVHITGVFTCTWNDHFIHIASSTLHTIWTALLCQDYFLMKVCNSINTEFDIMTNEFFQCATVRKTYKCQYKE